MTCVDADGNACGESLGCRRLERQTGEDARPPIVPRELADPLPAETFTVLRADYPAAVMREAIIKRGDMGTNRPFGHNLSWDASRAVIGGP